MSPAPQRWRAPLLGSLTGRMVLTAAVAVAVFALCFGWFSRVWVTRILGHDLDLRAAALANGLMVAVAEHAALGDRVGMHALLRETGANHPDVRYIAVLDRDGRLLGQSLQRPLSAAFLEVIGRQRRDAASLALRTELGLVRDVAVASPSPGRAVIHVGIAEQALTTLLTSMNQLLSLAAAAALVAGLLSAWLAGRRLNDPLRRLAQVSQEIAAFARQQDSLAEPMPLTQAQRPRPTGVREIDVLGQNLQQLSDSLAANRTRLWQTQQAMVRAERMAALGAFVAGTAHAVNNPLAGVRACLEMIEASPADVGRLRKYLTLAHEGLGRIQQLMVRLVRFVPKAPEEERLFDLHELLASSIAAQGQIHCDNQRVAVRLQLEAAAHWVRADADEAEQTLTNLLLNAAQVTPQGRDVVVRSCDDGPGGLRIDVDDAGPGVPAELRDRIFEPFFSTKPEGKGTGLGLWVAWRFAERVGGRLSVGDSPLGGARLSLWLPCQGAPQPGGPHG